MNPTTPPVVPFSAVRSVVRWVSWGLGVGAFWTAGFLWAGEPLATIGDRRITVSEVRLAAQRTGVATYDSNAVVQVATGLIDEAVLAREARRRGLERELRAEWDRQLAERLLATEVDAALASWQPTETEVDVWMREHPSAVRSPDVVDVWVLSVWTDAGGTNAAAARLAQVQASLADGRPFQELVVPWSDAPAERSGRPLRFVEGAVLATHPQGVIDAALGLRKPGERVGPIATARGWSLVELVERRPGTPLPSARAHAVAALRRERRAEQVRALVESISQRDGIAVDRAGLLRAVEVPVARRMEEPPRP